MDDRIEAGDDDINEYEALERGLLVSGKSALQRPRDLLDAVALDDVAGPHVLVLLEGHAALLARRHLAHLVLEALQRRQLAFVDDDVVADQADVRAALDDAVGHPAAGDLADLGDVED